MFQVKRLGLLAGLLAFVMLFAWIVNTDWTVPVPEAFVPQTNDYPEMFATKLNRQRYSHDGEPIQQYFFQDFTQFKRTGAKGTEVVSYLFDDGDLIWQLSAKQADDVYADKILLRGDVEVLNYTSDSPLRLDSQLLYVDVVNQQLTSPENVDVYLGEHKSSGEDFIADMNTGKIKFRFGHSQYAPVAP